MIARSSRALTAAASWFDAVVIGGARVLLYFGQWFVLFVLLGLAHPAFFLLALLTVLLLGCTLLGLIILAVYDWLVARIGDTATTVTLATVAVPVGLILVVWVLYLIDAHG